MAENSKIEWCDHTFNPWVGCSKISPACDHCYAQTWARRTGHPELWEGERRRTSAANWKQPLKWDAAARAAGTRMRVFCASLADVFDNDVPHQWRVDLFELIGKTTNIDWLLLTKRIGNAHRMLNEVVASWSDEDNCYEAKDWPHVWLGATIANQEEADRDIPKLLAMPAHVRFLSIEPMLGPIDLRGLMHRCPTHDFAGGFCIQDCGDWQRIHWVIAGGESGPGARPWNTTWAASLSNQCSRAGLPFLWKQHGEWAPNCLCGRPDACREIERPQPGSRGVMFRCGKKLAGRTLNGQVWDEFPVVEP